MDNFNPQNSAEVEKIIAQREKKRYLEELNDLEFAEASAQNRIFWTAISLLIVEPAATAGVVYYFWNTITTVAAAGGQIANLGQNLKYAAIAIAITFTFSSLSLLYNLWRVASLKSQIAKIRGKISRLG